jgi:hypothetical protein
MRFRFSGLIVVGLLLSACAVPPTPGTLLPVTPGLSVGISLPEGRWMVASDPPESLVAEMAEHVAHDLEAQGKEADPKSIQTAVAQRLAVNEYFIFNPVSGAHMEIDFSPLDPGEMAPGRGSVANSARYAADSLGSEEGISGLSSEVEKARVYGADYAYSLQARFMKHDVATRFYGLIGFVENSWFFIYYTDAERDPGDYPQAIQILRSVQVLRSER